MRVLATVTLLLSIACSAPPAVPTASPSPSPSASLPPAALRPLPANVAGIPGPTDTTATVAPHTPPGELAIGVARDFTLGHCGLISPIDIDGSLWDPIAGHDGNGGPLSEVQLSELINGTPTIVTLTAPNTAELLTPSGAVIALQRHDGPRTYFLCD